MSLDPSTELAVRRSLTLTCLRADEAPIEQLGELLADDITWSMGGRTWTGKAEVLEGLQAPRTNGMVGPGSGTRHLLSTVLVDEAESGARSRSSWMLVRAGATGVDVLMAGDYHDTWRTAGGDAVLVARRVDRL